MRVTVSPTRLDAWLDCRRRYRFQYVDRLPADGGWAHRSMGTAIHAALRDWFDIGSVRRSPQDAAGLVRMHWSSRGFRDAGHSALWLDAAAAMAQRYLHGRATPNPHSRERTLGALGTHVSITGRIDRLDECPPGDELVVVDYKTGRRAPTDDDARSSRTLALYALMVQRSLGRPAFEVQLHHIPTGAVATHRHSAESLQRQFDRADSIGRDIAEAEACGSAAAFPPSVGPLCGWCDFHDRCPEAQGLPAQPRWAGLPESP